MALAGLPLRLPVLQGHLDRDLHRDRARVAEEDVLELARRDRREQRAQFDRRLVGEPAEHHVRHARELRADGAVQHRVVVAVDRGTTTTTCRRAVRARRRAAGARRARRRQGRPAAGAARRRRDATRGGGPRPAAPRSLADPADPSRAHSRISGASTGSTFARISGCASPVGWTPSVCISAGSVAIPSSRKGTRAAPVSSASSPNSAWKPSA